MNPRSFQDYAELAMGTNDPAHLRSAISRAYYAAFHVALEYVKGSGVRVSKSDRAHGDVSKYFGNCSDEDAKVVGSELGDLKGQRNKADYDLNDTRPESLSNAKVWVMQARRNISMLDKIFSDATKRSAIETDFKKTEQMLFRGGSF